MVHYESSRGAIFFAFFIFFFCTSGKGGESMRSPENSSPHTNLESRVAGPIGNLTNGITNADLQASTQRGGTVKYVICVTSIAIMYICNARFTFCEIIGEK